MTKVAIMQPIIPLGRLFWTYDGIWYIYIFRQCSIWKRGWQQRNQIKTLKGNLFLTVPVKQNRYNQFINEVEIDNSTNFKQNHLKA